MGSIIRQAVVAGILSAEFDPSLAPPVLSTRGVSVAFMQTFIKWIRSVKQLPPSTLGVVQGMITPLTEDCNCSLYELLDPQWTGPPTVFISHAWDGSFKDLVDALGRLCTPAGAYPRRPMESSNLFVWIDIIAIAQPPVNKRVDPQKSVAVFTSTITRPNRTGDELFDEAAAEAAEAAALACSQRSRRHSLLETQLHTALHTDQLVLRLKRPRRLTRTEPMVHSRSSHLNPLPWHSMQSYSPFEEFSYGRESSPPRDGGSPTSGRKSPPGKGVPAKSAGNSRRASTASNFSPPPPVCVSPAPTILLSDREAMIAQVLVVIRVCAGRDGLVLVLGGQHLALDRLWCLWEVWMGVCSGRPSCLRLSLPSAGEMGSAMELLDRLDNLNVAEADASVPTDRAALLALVSRWGGGGKSAVAVAVAGSKAVGRCVREAVLGALAKSWGQGGDEEELERTGLMCVMMMHGGDYPGALFLLRGISSLLNVSSDNSEAGDPIKHKATARQSNGGRRSSGSSPQTQVTSRTVSPVPTRSQDPSRASSPQNATGKGRVRITAAPTPSEAIADAGVSSVAGDKPADGIALSMAAATQALTDTNLASTGAAGLADTSTNHPRFATLSELGANGTTTPVPGAAVVWPTRKSNALVSLPHGTNARLPPRAPNPTTNPSQAGGEYGRGSGLRSLAEGHTYPVVPVVVHEFSMESLAQLLVLGSAALHRGRHFGAAEEMESYVGRVRADFARAQGSGLPGLVLGNVIRVGLRVVWLLEWEDHAGCYSLLHTAVEQALHILTRTSASRFDRIPRPYSFLKMCGDDGRLLVPGLQRPVLLLPQNMEDWNGHRREYSEQSQVKAMALVGELLELFAELLRFQGRTLQAKDFELMAVSLVNPAAGRGNSGAAVSSNKPLSSLITTKAAGMLRMLPMLSRSAAQALASAPSPLVQSAEMQCRSQMHMAEQLYVRLAAFHISALDRVVRQRFLLDRATGAGLS